MRAYYLLFIYKKFLGLYFFIFLFIYILKIGLQNLSKLYG